DLRARGARAGPSRGLACFGGPRGPRRPVASSGHDAAVHRRGRRGAPMILLAGLAVGVFVYFLVGDLTGYAPGIKVRRLGRRTQISNRQLWLNQAGVEVVNTQRSRTPSRASFPPPQPKVPRA